MSDLEATVRDSWLDARPPTEPLGERYRRLLDEPLTPAAIRAELATAPAP